MATVYIAPTAQGLGDGTSAANAYGYSSLDTAEADAGNGGTILFTDGTYTFSGIQAWNAGGFADMTYKSLNRNGAYLFGDTICRQILVGSSTTSTVKLEGFKAANVHYYSNFSATTATYNLITHADTFEDGPANFGIFGSSNHGQNHVISNSSIAYFPDNSTQRLFFYMQGASIDNCSFFIKCPNVSANGITTTGNRPTATNSIFMSSNSSAIATTALDITKCTNCCVYDMSTDDTSGGTDNIFVDPQFVDSDNGDLRLRPTSPCIGAGTAS